MKQCAYLLVRVFFLLVVLTRGSSVEAFASAPLHPRKTLVSKTTPLPPPLTTRGRDHHVPATTRSRRTSSTTAVTLFPAASALGTAAVRSKPSTAVLAALTVLLVANIRRLLWPGYANRDPALREPLPPGRCGCPLWGSQVLVGSRDSGAASFWYRAAKRLGNPRVFRFFFMGRPGVCISGGERIKSLMNTEFEEDGVYVPVVNTEYTGPSLLGEQNGKKHAYLRKLVGQALTPAAVKRAVPNLYQASQKQVDRMIAASSNGDNTATAETICTDLTLEIAWKQILGLKLTTAEEEEEFVTKVNEWVGGIVDPRVSLNIGLRKTRGYKAKEWLEKKIEEKMDDLIENGPDDSTLSGMVFAADEDDPSGGRKLSREDILGNSLLLILAGSETSASTLTNAFLCLGKNPEAWRKLQAEQDAIIAKYGKDESMDKVILEKECPYLDAVVKESLRIKPVASGAPRKPKASFVMDGYQVPKQTLISWNIKLTHYLDPTTYRSDGSHMDITKGFQPERWLDITTKPTTDFMPMGAGPHYCLGAYLAYAEMKVFLAVAARSMDFELAGSAAQDKVQWKRMSIIPKERSGVPLIARPKGETLVGAVA